jgi:hypothetical protein
VVAAWTDGRPDRHALQSLHPFLRIEFAKGRQEVGRVTEAWNPYARLPVSDTDLPIAVDD